AAARPLAGEPQPRDRAHPLRVGGDGRRGAGALDEAGGGLRARGEGDPGYAARRRDGGAEGQRQRPAAEAGQVTRQLIDIQPPMERAFLVGAPRKGTADAQHVEEHLDELARLADTAGASVVGRTSQRIEAPTPNFYLGQGKVEELKGILADARATLVLVDEPLSPVQGVNLEKALALRVMDRSEVILDIFATRARSAEAKMEVELAQLEYLLPRLTRMWTHLSRIRGAIGLRGPGETQLETDRRAIRRKLSLPKKRLEDVADHRANQRQGRRACPSAAPVGHTTGGKPGLLPARAAAGVFRALARERYPPAVLTSANPQSAIGNPQSGGVEGLRSVLRTSAQALRPIARVSVPLANGKLLAALHRDAEVMAEMQVDGVVQVTARVEAWLLGKLRREGIEVEIAP